MRLAQATYQAMKYATKHWHYSKTMPANAVGYSVFNDKNEWCGCILYAIGANRHISKQFNCNTNEIIELVRMALNGKQNKTSKALALSIMLIKKHIPYLKGIVSYADENQGHLGTIYQATNWNYLGEFAKETGITINGKETHRRTVNSRYNTSSLLWLKTNVDPNATKNMGKPKHKYFYCFDKNLESELLIKPYPKKQAAASDLVSGDQSENGGLIPTLPLQTL